MSDESSKETMESPSSALAQGSLVATPRKSPAELITSHDPNLTARDGGEAAVARFCDQAFVNPESARTGSAALLEAFDDSGLWLANLVHPHQLVAELRQSCSTLTRVIITQWTRQGETHKLVRLGAALLESDPPITTHEAGQISALLASLLGILRPPRAQDLLEMCRPLLKDSIDPHLLREARDWVEIGRLLESLPAEDRIFWNRRLREPENDWAWDTPEARSALRRLAPILANAAEDADLAAFQRTVPACWWDLLRERQKTPPSRLTPIQVDSLPVHSVQPLLGLSQNSSEGNRRAPSRAGIYAVGVITGLACMALFLWLEKTGSQPVPQAVAASTPAPSPAPAPLPDPAPVSAPSQPKASIIPVAEPPPPAAPARPEPKVAFRSPQQTPSPTPPRPRTPQTIKREAAAVAIAEEHRNLQRLHKLLVTGTFRENEAMLNGRSGLSPSDHQVLIRWLMLDPPQHPESRVAVAKLAARLLDPKDLLPTLSLCISADSPNAVEARQCAAWALELHQPTLTAQQQQTLQSMQPPLAQNGN